MEQPLISILMPVKNTATFLSACMDSIRTQDYTNWELIAVNDHSSDASETILRTYSEKDRRITVLNNKESGIIPALRLAYGHSKGKIITRMDSDDLMLPNKLSLLQKMITNKGRGHIAVGLVKYFSTSNLGDGYKRYEKWLNELTKKGTNFQSIYKECVIPSPCWMVYREDFDLCGAFQSDFYPEDYDLCFRFYQKKLKVIPCQEIIHLWRDYPTRSSRTLAHYADNRFLSLKLHYFLELDYEENRPLVIWGAGKKGKFIVRYLIERNYEFHWVCNNDKKIGKTIYDIPLKATNFLASLVHPQCIIAVANDINQYSIKTNLAPLQSKSLLDYYFFC